MAKQTQLFPVEQMQEDITNLGSSFNETPNLDDVKIETAQPIEVQVEEPSEDIEQESIMDFLPEDSDFTLDSIDPYERNQYARLQGFGMKQVIDLATKKLKEKEKLEVPKTQRDEFLPPEPKEIKEEVSVEGEANTNQVLQNTGLNSLGLKINEDGKLVSTEKTGKRKKRYQTVISEEGELRQLKEKKSIQPSDDEVNKTLLDLTTSKRVELSKQPLTDFSATNKKGESLLPNEEGVLAVLNSQSETYAGKITEATRGKVTQAATRQLADLIGMTENGLTKAILDRKMGGVVSIEGQGLAETMLAARDLLVTEVSKLDDIAAQIKNKGGSPEELLAFRKQMTLVTNLQRQIKGSQTEIARALAQYNIPTREGKGALRRAADIENVLQEFGGETDVRAMASMYSDLPKGKARFEFTKNSFRKKAFNAIYEVWINALLSSGVTHFKNFVGNTLTTINQINSLAGAATINSIRKTFGGQDSGVAWSDVKATIFAVTNVMPEAFAAAGKAYKGEGTIAGSKLDYNKIRRRAFSAEEFEKTGSVGTAIDVLGNVFTLGRAPTKALEFEDTFFKVIANRMSLMRSAYKEAERQGLGKDLDEMAEFIADYVYNPPPSAIEEGETVAKYITLQSDLKGGGEKAAHALIKKTPGLRWFLPFFKTPLNAIKYASDHTPLGIFWGDTRRMLKKGGADADVARARIAIGSMATAVGFGLMMNDTITGGGPADRNLKRQMRDAGWQPYSIMIGGKYRSYAGFEPFSTVLMIIGDLKDVAVSGFLSDTETEEVVWSTIGALGYSLTNKTMLQGFANLIATLQEPERSAGKTARQIISGLVPSGVANINKSYFDPVLRDTSTLIKKFKSRIPGMSTTLNAKRNLWGVKKVSGGAFGPDFISPIYQSIYNPNDADKEIFSLNFAPTEHPDTVQFPSAPPGNPIKLSDPQVDWFHKRAGELSLENVNFLIKSGSWEAQKKLEGRDWAREQIKAAVREARQVALDELENLSPHSSEIRQKIQKLEQKYYEQQMERMQ